MKPNVVFLLIDNLRSDQTFGTKKKSCTPNLDTMLNKGVYFENCFSSADGTILSLNCIFNSKFPTSNLHKRAKKIILSEENLFSVLKNNGYNIFGLVPEMITFQPIAKLFENEEKTYKFVNNFESLDSGLTNKILTVLNLINHKRPSFFYIHLMDLHPDKQGKYLNELNEMPIDIINSSNYVETVSGIDPHLGKIFDVLDLSNTILVLTADHGDRIPYENIKNTDFEPKFEITKKIGKRVLPTSIHQLGGKFLYKSRKIISNKKIKENRKKLSNYQNRSRESYFIHSLYDESLHVPLLLVGNTIPSEIFSENISQVDIFPTICDLVDIENKLKNDGENLLKIIAGKKYEKKSIYLHTIPYEKPHPTDMVGIRDSNFKYFRAASDKNENVHLYNLKIDPLENTNIAETNSSIISEFETLISKFEANQNLSKTESDEDPEVIEELKKLGYL